MGYYFKNLLKPQNFFMGQMRGKSLQPTILGDVAFPERVHGTLNKVIPFKKRI
jgi:hypothetical protein